MTTCPDSTCTAPVRHWHGTSYPDRWNRCDSAECTSSQGPLPCFDPRPVAMSVVVTDADVDDVYDWFGRDPRDREEFRAILTRFAERLVARLRPGATIPAGMPCRRTRGPSWAS